MIHTLTVKKIKLPRTFLYGLLHRRLALLNEHKKGNARIGERIAVEWMQQFYRHSSNTTTRISNSIING